MPTPKTVAAYLALATQEQRAALQKLRKTIKSAAPKATEEISYGIVGYRYLGKPLIYFGHAKKHCALYGSGLGTIRFTPEEPLPASKVKALVKTRMGEIESASKAPARRASTRGKRTAR